jgi:hypothetical protein
MFVSETFNIITQKDQTNQPGIMVELPEQT